MPVNIRMELKGDVEEIVKGMIQQGHAATATAAVRLAISHYNHCINREKYK